MLRGTVEDMAGDAIFGYMTPISFAMTPGERAAIARLGCLEGILCGTTTMVEPFRHVAGYAQGMVDTGLRLYLSENAADALTLKIRHGVYEHDRTFGQEFLDRTIELIERFHGAEDGRVHCQISGPRPRRLLAVDAGATQPAQGPVRTDPHRPPVAEPQGVESNP